MSEEIIKVLDELGKKFGIAIDWTSENVMPYAEELCKKFINYEIATSIYWIVLIGILFIVPLILAIKYTPKAAENYFDIDEPSTFASIASIICTVGFGIAFMIVAGEQSLDVITCLTFPEKAIFEYVTTLL